MKLILLSVTIQHILLRCPHFHQQRRACARDLFRHANGVLCMSNLLGFIDYLPNKHQQQRILDITATFLKHILEVREI